MSDRESPSGPLSDSALPPGTGLNEFEIVGLVGGDECTLVYEAMDHVLVRRVTLHEYLPDSLATRPGGKDLQLKEGCDRDVFNNGRKSFVREAMILARFDHPSLIKVYRFWEGNGTAYCTTPWYAGEPLHAVLQKMASPPDEQWLRAFLEPLAGAVATLHAEQCWHRDIAPESVLMLTGSCQPMLLGLGAARRFVADRTDGPAQVLRHGFAAVEQYAEIPGAKVGPWTDVYALAALIYFAITGKTPVSAIQRLVSDPLPPLSQLAAGRYTRPFLQAIDHALAVRPADRTASVEQFLDELDMGAAAGRTIAARPSFQPVPYRENDEDHRVARAILPPVQARPSMPAAMQRPPASPAPSAPSRSGAGIAGLAADLVKLPFVAIGAVLVAPVTLARDAVSAWQSWRERANAEASAAASNRRRDTTADQRQAAPAASDDPLMFGASAPSHCAPDGEFSMAFMAYVQSMRATVVQQVQAMVGPSHRTLLDFAPSVSAAWQIGTPFTVGAGGRAFKVEPPSQTVIWDGRKQIVGFAVTVLPHTIGPAVLTVTVQVEGVVVACLPLQVEVRSVSSAGQPLAATALTREATRAAPSSVFASYASRDADEVAGRLSTLARWAPHLDIFQDCLDLKPNEAFKSQLAKQIADRDAFLLFWSRHAAASTWVRWELETALAKKPAESIVPMPLEDPMLAPPPAELSDFHFRDRYLIAGVAMQHLTEAARLAR